MTRNLFNRHAFPLTGPPERAQCVYSVHINGVRVYMHVSVQFVPCPAPTSFAWMSVFILDKACPSPPDTRCPVCDEQGL